MSLPAHAIATGTTVRLIDNESNPLLAQAFTDADARELAKRWNAHDALLSALERLTAWHDAPPAPGSTAWHDALVKAMREAHAVIDWAKG